MAHTITKLPNGLPVIFVPQRGTSVAAFLYVAVGSRCEAKEESGISHMIEHMHFKGTEKRPTYDEINRDLDALGAEFNAFTGKEYTGYYVKVAHESLAEGLEIISDLVFHSTFPEAELEREKTVIIEEYKMYNENPRMKIPHVLDQAAFGDHPLGRDIIGTPETIVSYTRDSLYTFKARQYNPKNMVLVLAGQFRSASALGLLRSYYARHAGSQDWKPTSLNRFAKFVPSDTYVHIPAASQVNFGVSFPSCGASAAPVVRTSVMLMSVMFGASSSSRLFTELREKRGLCYSIGTSYDLYAETGTFQIFSDLDRTRLAEACAVLGEEIRKVRANGFTAEEIIRAKKNVRGRLLLAAEDPAHVARGYANAYIARKRVESLEEILARIERISSADIQRAVRESTDLRRMTIAAIGNFPTRQVFLRDIAGLRNVR